MEINTEINKVFGEEMAKLFAKSLSEEELTQKANLVWNKLNYRESSSWYSSSESQIDKLIKEKMVEALTEKVKEITSSDEFKEEMQSIAKTMVKEITEETHRKIVDEVSNRMMMLAVGHCDSSGFSYGMHTMIAEVVNSMIPNNR